SVVRVDAFPVHLRDRAAAHGEPRRLYAYDRRAPRGLAVEIGPVRVHDEAALDQHVAGPVQLDAAVERAAGRDIDHLREVGTAKADAAASGIDEGEVLDSHVVAGDLDQSLMTVTRQPLVAADRRSVSAH